MFLRLLSTIVLLLSPIYTTANSATNVGVATLNYIDTSRPSWDGEGKRPVTSHLFYPTAEAHSEPLLLGQPGKELFNAGEVAWAAKPLFNEKMPLILMSHGTGGSALQMLWIAQRLVENGYLVLGVNHHGNTAIEPKKYAAGYTLWWERTRDLSFSLNSILKDENWSQHIDPSKIGVVGFSLGGYTALSAIGGITDRSLFKDFCHSQKRDFTCEGQAEFPNINEAFKKVENNPYIKVSLSEHGSSYKIDQISAAYILSPAVSQALTQESLMEISVPVSVAVGSLDSVAPSLTNAHRIASLISGAEYKEIEKASHYTFLSTCTPLGKKYLEGLCEDHKTLDRSQVHESLSLDILKFFDQKLNRKEKQTMASYKEH
ncbi:Alpha/beta hydrolase family protein [Microbulbifer sp. THAF38]|nr:Alpha/beta hydrolase family protein [Microbulbifer sp. THAF38]